VIEQMRREINRALAGTRTAFRAVLTSCTTGTRVQRVNAEGLAGEPLQEMELLQQFGHTSAPPDGATLVVIPLGGRTSAAVVVASEHGGYRFKVDHKGEAALYNQWGDSIHMKKDRSIRVEAQAKLEVVAPLATFSGDVNVAGSITSGANITAAGNVADQGGAKTKAGMRDTFNAHTHPVASGIAQPTGSAM